MPKVQSPRQVRLNEWQLKGFPFPASPYADPFSKDPLLNGTVFDKSLHKEEIEILKTRVLGGGWSAGLKSWRWLWSESQKGKNLGTGKTAFLSYITNEINADYGERFLRQGASWLAVYARIEPGTHDLGKMNAQVLAGFCNDARDISPASLVLAKLRQQVIMRHQIEHSIAHPGKGPIKKYLNDTWLAQNQVDTQLLRQAVEALLKEHQVRSDIAAAFAGGDLHGYLRNINNGQNIRTPGTRLANNATSILLEDMARIIKIAEIQHLTIFLDDFYFLVKNLGEEARRKLAEGIRKVSVDGQYFSITENHLFNWVAVMHPKTAPTFVAAWSNADMQKEASLNFQTVQNEGDRLLLRRLKLDEGESIIKTYLERAHQNTVPTPTHPFTPDAIQAIINILKQNDNLIFQPRDLLKETSKVFMEALDNTDFSPPISVKFVEGVMAPQLLKIEETEDEDLLPEEEDEPLAQLCSCGCHGDESITDIIPIFGGTTQDNGKLLLRTYCKACRNDISMSAS